MPSPARERQVHDRADGLGSAIHVSAEAVDGTASRSAAPCISKIASAGSPTSVA